MLGTLFETKEESEYEDIKNVLLDWEFKENEIDLALKSAEDKTMEGIIDWISEYQDK